MTTIAARRHRATGSVRWIMTLQAWAPAARGLPLRTIGAALALAVVPTIVVLVKGGSDLSGALVAAVVIGAPCVAFFVEDPAGETLAASPTSLVRRRVLRLGAIAVGLAVTFAVLVAVALAHGPLAGEVLARRAAEVGAVSGLAASVGGLSHRQGVAGAGPLGAVAGAVSALLIASFAVRYDELPPLLDGEHHARWWLVALVGWAAAAWSSRDPSR